MASSLKSQRRPTLQKKKGQKFQGRTFLFPHYRGTLFSVALAKIAYAYKETFAEKERYTFQKFSFIKVIGSLEDFGKI